MGLLDRIRVKAMAFFVLWFCAIMGILLCDALTRPARRAFKKGE